MTKMKIKKAIYSDPYVHVLWDDGTKTSSKCDEQDEYDELTGFLMCIMKKMMNHKDMRKVLNTFVYGNDKKYVKRDKKYTKPVLNPETNKATFVFNDADLHKDLMSFFDMLNLI